MLFFCRQNNKSKQGGRKPALTGVSGKSAITGIVEAKVQSSLCQKKSDGWETQGPLLERMYRISQKNHPS
jgi:hypothetical protein